MENPATTMITISTTELALLVADAMKKAFNEHDKRTPGSVVKVPDREETDETCKEDEVDKNALRSYYQLIAMIDSHCKNWKQVEKDELLRFIDNFDIFADIDGGSADSKRTKKYDLIKELT